MARLELAINTTVCFETQFGESLDAPSAPAQIQFNTRLFTWHPARQVDDRIHWPVVSTSVSDVGDRSALQASQHLVSALAWVVNRPFTAVMSVVAGFKNEFDTPLIGQPGLPPSARFSLPKSITVNPDPRLRLTLALFREALASASPFYEFLAYYNALDATFDNDEKKRDTYIDKNLANVESHSRSTGNVVQKWSDFLRDHMRNAVAHAVRSEGKPVLDPDDFADQQALRDASAHVSCLIRKRVPERWRDGIVVDRALSSRRGSDRSSTWAALTGLRAFVAAIGEQPW